MIGVESVPESRGPCEETETCEAVGFPWRADREGGDPQHEIKCEKDNEEDEAAEKERWLKLPSSSPRQGVGGLPQWWRVLDIKDDVKRDG